MIEEKSFEPNIDTFTKLHSFVAQEEALKWGAFRKSFVNIGGTDYQVPHADLLEDIFTNGIEEIKMIHHPIIKAITMFLFGAKYQFFYDGDTITPSMEYYVAQNRKFGV